MADITLQHGVQALLDELVTDGDEVGLQAAVIKGGALVADAQSGIADPVSGEPVSAGTLFFAGSTAKGVGRLATAPAGPVARARDQARPSGWSA